MHTSSKKYRGEWTWRNPHWESSTRYLTLQSSALSAVLKSPWTIQFNGLINRKFFPLSSTRFFFNANIHYQWYAHSFIFFLEIAEKKLEIQRKKENQEGRNMMYDILLLLIEKRVIYLCIFSMYVMVGSVCSRLPQLLPHKLYDCSNNFLLMKCAVGSVVLTLTMGSFLGGAIFWLYIWTEGLLH